MTDTSTSSAIGQLPRSLTGDRKEWIFNLDANANWMQDFTSHYQSVDVSIWADEDDSRPPYYQLSSSHLNGLSGAEAVMRAKDLLTVLNGILRLRQGAAFDNFKLRDGWHADTEKRAAPSMWETVPIPLFPANIQQVQYRRQSNFVLSNEGERLFLCRSDDFLLAIFQILGLFGFTFVSLYHVLDTIVGALKASRQNSQTKAVAALGKKSKGELDSFTYTANNYTVAGVHSRHGKPSKVSTATKLPALTLSEAVDVMLPIIQGFVDQRVAATFNNKWNAVLVS